MDKTNIDTMIRQTMRCTLGSEVGTGHICLRNLLHGRSGTGDRI